MLSLSYLKLNFLTNTFWNKLNNHLLKVNKYKTKLYNYVIKHLPEDREDTHCQQAVHQNMDP